MVRTIRCARAGNLKEAIRHGSLQKEGRAKALEVALLARDIARGCQAIHRYSIIHGDLKPHNVLLTADSRDERGWVGKIADFGLSVKIKRGEQHVSGIQHGTEGYVAPEVLQTRRMVPVSDVYSFGIIMWELWHSRLYYEEYRAAVRRMCVLPSSNSCLEAALLWVVRSPSMTSRPLMRPLVFRHPCIRPSIHHPCVTQFASERQWIAQFGLGQTKRAQSC
jgi:serine/threonine protein kinase